MEYKAFIKNVKKSMNVNNTKPKAEEIIEDFESAEYYKNKFLELRAASDKKIRNKGSIEAEIILADEYEELCTSAVSGDIVAQDMLSYWFKRGNLAVPENVELSMKWLLMAASNGNKHSIDKLAMFLTYAYDTIVYSDVFYDISDIYEMTEDNYKYILGELVCKKIIENLGVTSLDLAKERTDGLAYNPESMRKYTTVLNKSIPFIIHDFEEKIRKYKKI